MFQKFPVSGNKFGNLFQKGNGKKFCIQLPEIPGETLSIILPKMPELTDPKAKCQTIKPDIAPGAPCTVQPTFITKFVF